MFHMALSPVTNTNLQMSLVTVWLLKGRILRMLHMSRSVLYCTDSFDGFTHFLKTVLFAITSMTSTLEVL